MARILVFVKINKNNGKM
jgi:hypothetical protein